MGAQVLRSEYEELRSEALQGTGRGIGLTLFLRSGMRSWMEGVSTQTFRAALAPAHRPAFMVPASRNEITLILAGMAFDHCQGGST